MPIDMLVVFALVVGVVIFALYFAWWDKHRKQRYAARVHADWARRGYTIHQPPVFALYYGSEPRASHASVVPEGGALGLANQQLIFVKAPQTVTGYTVDFDAIRWIGVRAILIRSGKYVVNKSALIVHYEAVDSWSKRRRWYVAAFVSDHGYDVAYALSQQLGIKFRDMGTTREDHGPVDAQWLQQDIYGKWHPVLPDGYQDEVDWEHLKRELYLAPDRLIFNWISSIHFTQMRRIEVYERGTVLHELNPFSRDLLRIEYTLEDSPQVAGFLVHRADQWGEAIHQRTQIPLQIHQGRKKKA